MSDDQQSIDDLAAAYALNALSPADRARFEAEATPAARAEAAGLADTASLLAGDEVAPPPTLRASVLDAIAREPQLPAPEESAAAESAAAPSPVAPDAAAGTAGALSSPAAPAAPLDDRAPREGPRRLGPAERRARARWQPVRVLGAVAAGAALLLGGVALGSQLGTSEQEALGAVVAATDAQRSEVELPDGTVATVIWSPEQGQSAILFEGLGEAPHGHTYQAWYIDEAGPHDAGTFDASGSSTAFLLDGEMTAGTAVGVTVEPEGGSEAPTTDPILVVQT